ncbi:fumarylacetoacetate hydrolase family protein [Hydrogenophaga borbori]
MSASPLGVSGSLLRGNQQSYLSRAQTLMPGHVVTSGAFPGGCGLDANLKIQTGDVVEMRIDKLGALVSKIG